jgi:methyl-accepting chemotaxis protein
MSRFTFTFTMRLKLIASFAGVLLIFLAVAFFNLHQVNQIKKSMEIQNDKVDLKVMALELKEMVQELNIIASGMEISKKPEYIDKYNSKRQAFNDMVKRIGDTATTDDLKKWRSQMIIASVDYINNFDSAAKMVQDPNMKPLDLDSNLLYLYTESQTLKDTLFTLVDKFYVTYAEDAKQAIGTSTDLLNSTSRVMLSATLIVLLVTAAIAYLLIRSFVKPIARLQKAVSLIASGDLRHQIDSKSRDELGQLSQSFDLMVASVRQMLDSTQRIASSLSEHSHSFHSFSQVTASANSDILRAIHEISLGADEQASQTEKSSQIITELEAEIRYISQYTDLMKQTSLEASTNTRKGTSSVHALKQSSEESQQVLQKVHEAMESLSASSNQIGKIIHSITEISTQTHVLALNAAIEAARAGVHGKGFSVIADEVRSLSGQTNESSRVIGQIIISLQKQIKELQEFMLEARENTTTQNNKVNETIDSFDVIEQSMLTLTEQIEQIHEKIDQTRMKNNKLVESVQFVAAIAQETAAGVEEVNSTSIQQDASIHKIADESDEILNLSQQLFQEISKFQISTDDDNLVRNESTDSIIMTEIQPTEILEVAVASESQDKMLIPV